MSREWVTYDPILDASGNRIGVNTPGGRILSADPANLQWMLDQQKHRERAQKARMTERVKKARDQRMAQLMDEADINPAMVPGTLRELTDEEKRILHYAFNSGVDHVALPYVVKCLSKTRDYRTLTESALEKRVERAARRLYNRGLATVQKNGKGIVFTYVSRQRVRDIIRREAAAKAAERPPDFNLIKVPCKIQTSPERGSKTDILAMPKRCSLERLKACKILSGLRMLLRPDKVEINTLFERYSGDIEEKIIALLDVKKGEVIGSEYSTRFNDMAKAAKALRKYDACLEKSLRDHYKAVFLTLTTDPNLTDEELAANKAAKIQTARRKLSEPGLSDKSRAYWTRQLYKWLGPEKEIADLEESLASGTLSPDRARSARQRLAEIAAENVKATELMAAVKDPTTPVRTREKMISSLKRMNRWEYVHDPSGFRNLWEANRNLSIAWNRFTSYLKKRNGGIRPKYIAAYEFTESGLIHIHALIFVEYLAPNEEISREWRRCGQGEISYVYSLKNVQKRDGTGREWRWNSQSRPSDAKTTSGGDYLKKYLKKCLLAMMDGYTSPSEIQSMYWAMNKRMFTYSRSLLSEEAERAIEEAEGIEEEVSPYAFYRILSADEAEDVVDRMVYRRVRPKWQYDEEDPPDKGGTT